MENMEMLEPMQLRNVHHHNFAKSAPLALSNFTRKQAHIHRIKQKYDISEQSPDKTVLSARVEFLKQNKFTEKNLLDILEQDLRTYAKTNLNPVGLGDNYTNMRINIGDMLEIAAARSDTKSERVSAVNLILDMLKTSSTEEIYDFVMTDQLQKLSGVQEKKFNIFRLHLSNAIQKFINAYQTFKKQTTSKNIAEILLNEEVFQELNVDDLSTLFWYYEPQLVADVLINIYEKSPIILTTADYQYQFTDKELRAFLSNDTNAIDLINTMRSSIKATQLLPVNARIPGRNQMADAGLSPFELFQYDENTIFATEHYLREKYKSILANKIKENNEFYTQQKKSPYYFYFISAGPYMLLDPANKNNQHYNRYLLFKKHIQELIESYQYKKNSKKPIIFCGIMNIDGTHYLPYFIYKDKKNIIQIITVDPSPAMYPEYIVNKSHKIIDSKLKTFKRLQIIFKDIFPNSQLSDPNVAQMLRERDCGPNSATTLRDAFSTCLAKHPLLYIKNDILTIDATQLTVKASAIGINHYTNTLVYPAELEENSLKNRAWWMKELRQLKMITPVSIPIHANENQKLTIDDVYEMNDQLHQEFDYNTLAETQEHQDNRNTNISTVQSLLLAHPEGNQLVNSLIAEYKNTLQLPNSGNLERFIKSKIANKVEQSVLTSSHNNNMKTLADDVIFFILHDSILEKLELVFRKDYINKITPQINLNANQLVDEFLKNNQLIFKKLNAYYQRNIKNKLQSLAKEAVDIKLLEAHASLLKELLEDNIYDYLYEIKSLVDDTELVQALIQIISQTTHATYSTVQIENSVYFLLNFNPDLFNHLLISHKDNVVNQLSQQVEEKVLAICAIDQFSLTELLTILNNKEEPKLPFNQLLSQTAQDFLKTKQIHLTEQIPTENYLYFAIFYKVQQQIFQRIHSILEKRIEDKILNIFQNTAIKTEMVANLDLLQIYNLMIYHETLLPPYDESFMIKMINKYAHEDTLLGTSLLQPIINNFTKEIFHSQIVAALKTSLASHYTMISKIIIGGSNERLIRENEEILLYQEPAEIADTLYFNLSNADFPGMKNIFNEFFLTKKNHLIQSKNFNALGKDFHQWFCENVLNDLKTRNDKIQRFKSNLLLNKILIDKIPEALASIKHKDSLNPTVTKISAFQIQIDKMISALEQLPLFDLNKDENNLTSFHDCFLQMQNTFAIALQTLCQHLLKVYYQSGEIKPGTPTTNLRALFCALLGMNTPQVLTDQQAVTTDEQIIAKINSLSFHLPFAIPVKESLTLLNITELPDTYNLPLTSHLIFLCISYWYNERPAQFHLKPFNSLFSRDTLPAIIRYLIKLINSTQEINEVEINEIEKEHLKAFLHKEIKDPFAIYSSPELLDRICAALLKTTTLNDSQATSLKFSDLKIFLSLKENASTIQRLRKTVTSVPKTIRIPETEIQEKLRIKIRELRKIDPKVNINIPNIRKEIIRELTNQHSVTVHSEENIVNSIINVRESELKRSTLASLAIFGRGLTALEKALLQIQSKHNQIDFNLDMDDLKLLNIHIRKHWYKIKAEGNPFMKSRYFKHPNRKDKVYIAMSELLSMLARKRGEEISYIEILMPNEFKLLSHRMPEVIFAELKLPDEENHIDLIPLAKLIVTQSGYAFNIDWIINAYTKTRSLKNFYTQKEFTHEEITNICMHPDSGELIKQVWSNQKSMITPITIKLLRDYLNNAIFDSGFHNYYNSYEDKLAFNAYTKFNLELTKLPFSIRKGLMDEIIPGGDSTETVKKNFAISEINNGDRCLTLRGVQLAKVVIAYEGDNHGLKNKNLVSRAFNETTITRRPYLNKHPIYADSESPQLEQFLIELAEGMHQHEHLNGFRH